MTTTSVPVSRSVAPPATDPVRVAGACAAIAGGLALIVSFLVVPGPDVADVHKSGWVPGHALSAVAFALLALGMPVITGSLGRRLGVPGIVGCAALTTRYVLSTGSHLYSLWILPRLATHPGLHHDVQPEHALANIYGGHADWFDLAIAVGLLGLVYALARCGRGMRTVTVLLALAAVSESLGFPFGLAAFAVVAIWLGARLLRHGDVLVPLRADRSAP